MKAIKILKEELEINIPYARENLRYIQGKFFDAQYKMNVDRRKQLLEDALDELNIIDRDKTKRCFDCKDKSDCYSYKCLTDDQTYFMSCPAYEPIG